MVLSNFIQNILNSTNNISIERQENLNILVDYIDKNINGTNIPLIFICTHNSRRSFFTQVWAKVAADYFGFNQIAVYSGGTSETEIYKETINALSAVGLKIIKLTENNNPIYAVKYHPQKYPIIGFSKIFDHPFNPKERFAAIMTCGNADANCPYIPEASARISLTYIDPKQSDGTPQETQTYLDKSAEIAAEMFYVFKQIKNNEQR